MALETKVAEMEKKGFFSSLKKGLLDTGKLYLDITKRPHLLAIGTYNVVKDIFYELPKSFIKNQPDNLQARLNENASQALGISEVVGIPSTYLGVFLFRMAGADDYVASTIGGPVGNYCGAVSSYLASYALLTRGKEGYSISAAIKDSGKVIKDCLPATLALYATNAPSLSALIALGTPVNLAVGVMLAFGTVVFTGVAKHSAQQNIKESAK